jgi:hypothetical protein
MHTLKPRPATPRGWSGGSTAIYFFAGGGRFGAEAVVLDPLMDGDIDFDTFKDLWTKFEKART